MTSSFEPSGFFVLRTPLLPVEALRAPADELLDRPELREALFLASPALLEARAAGRDVEDVLTAYLTRASTRCTPFGLFAGCSTGTLGDRTALVLDDVGAHGRHTRVDNDVLFALATRLEADPDVRPGLRWRPNTSVYRAGGRLHYAEARLTGTLRTHHLVAVHESEELRATLDRAASGATLEALAAALVDDEITLDEARDFLDAVAASQLLVSDLELAVTGDEPIVALAERVPALADVPASLAKVDAAGVGADPVGHRALAARLEADPGRLLQVDLVPATRAATLGPRVVAELSRAIEVLARLTSPPDADDALAAFRDALHARWGDREVPLALALDDELGIGFGQAGEDGGPLLGGVEVTPLGRPAASRPWTARDDALLALLTGALRDGRREIALSHEDVSALEQPDRLPLPDALAVIATVVAPSAEAADRGQLRVLVRGLDGPSGAGILGRFCHGDPALHAHVRDHLRREEALRPEVVFAEVVHLPDGRLGNIVCRPVLRDHEIPYLGRSGAPAEHQLPIADLVVSVQDGRVVLRSQRLGREVAPRLTAAHDVDGRALAPYRFLAALQRQGVAGRHAWSWGPLAGSAFLPRVTFGRLVLARARWTLRGAELASLDVLPRLVALADGDNELVCDIDDDRSRAALARQLRGRAAATFVEVLPGFEDLCVEGPGGRFTHEVVVPFVRAGAAMPGPRPRPPASTVRRSFPPGSAWTYATLATGPAAIDRVLTEVAPLVAPHADSWFFVRYADPTWHLRLRFHGGHAAVIDALHAAAAPLLADGTVWRLQLETYDREVERYGGDAGMALSEAVFHADSEAVLTLLGDLEGDDGLDRRWRLALLGTDRLLDDLGFDLAAKAEWARRRRDGFRMEMRVDGAAVGRRWRAERAELDALLDVGHPVIAQRSSRLAPIVAQLRARGADVESLASSYAHMHANRLLRSAHRAQELVLHDLLHRLYLARLHR